jgi:hypothetical protein
VLGRYKGVCKDLVVGGLDDVQYHTAARVDGINVITFRRSLISGTFLTIFAVFLRTKNTSNKGNSPNKKYFKIIFKKSFTLSHLLSLITINFYTIICDLPI